MKKILCFILALLLLCPPVFAENDLSFVFSAAEGKVGDTVTITASSKGAPTASSFRLVLAYDPAVLKPIEVRKLDVEGLFMSNIDFNYDNGKEKIPAVNALSAASNKSFEGDCDLFEVSFQIIGKPTGGKSVIEIPYYECYSPDLKALSAKLEECAVTLEGESQQGGSSESEKEELPENNPDEGGNTNDGATNEDPSGGTESTPPSNDGGSQTPAPETQGNENKPAGGKDEKPSSNKEEKPSSQKDEIDFDKGDWEIKEEEDKVILSQEDDTHIFNGEFHYDDTNTLTDIDLFDEEGEQIGTVKVEKDKDGKYKVVEFEKTKAPFNHLFWIIPAVIILTAVGTAFIYLSKVKKQKED